MNYLKVMHYHWPEIHHPVLGCDQLLTCHLATSLGKGGEGV